MSQLSPLIKKLPINPIRFLTPLVEKREHDGIEFYKINIGQPDLKADILITNSFKKFSNEFENIEYTSANGRKETRKAWSHGYYEGKFDPKDVVLTNGGSEGMMLCYLALLDNDQANLTFSPIYPNYESYAVITNRKIYSIPRKVETGYAMPSKETVDNFIQKHPDIKVITLISPDNPTGAVMKEKEIINIFELAEKYDLWVIVDEAYRDIRFNDDSVVISDIVSKHKKWMQRTVFIATNSKEFSACGLRSGALLCRNEMVINAIIKLVRPRLSTNEINQKVIIKALYSPRENRKSIKEIYKKRRDVVINAFEEMGIKMHTPEGSLYCLPDLAQVGIKDTF